MSYDNAPGLISSTSSEFSVGSGKLSVAPVPVRLDVDTVSINGTESTGLAIPLAASTNYILEAFVKIVGDGVASPALQIHVLAAGASLVGGVFEEYKLGTGDLVSATVLPAVTTNFLSGTGLADTFWANIRAVVKVGVTATSFQLDLVSTTVNTPVKAGSYAYGRVVA